MQPLQQLAWTLPENLVLSDLQVSLANTFDLKSGPVMNNSGKAAFGVVRLRGRLFVFTLC
ncbi:MAG TPA: hypothetical protein ENK96_07105 [Desulfobulbaceae bacterium]|nr:hypothetical protein [Desulfobulbaceae bacterium]